MSDKNQKTKKSGPQIKYSDEQMKDLALKIKKKYKGKQLNYLLLEKETGIGRHTWKRRIDDFIQELNKPILRDFRYTDSDEIYFPNIESIFEAFGDNKQRIINELHYFEVLFQEQYDERIILKNRLEKLGDFEKKIEEYTEIIATLRQEVMHYKNLYEQIMVSSIEPHLRDQLGLKDDLLDFNNHIERNTSLTNFQEYFPKVTYYSEQESKNENVKNENMEELKKQFDKLF